jgi:hypothetical protein
VTFHGNSTMAGFVVFENKNSSAVNVINGSGNLTYGNLPTDSQFDSLRAIKGISMLAPTASLQIAARSTRRSAAT